MKIDMFPHILPRKFYDRMLEVSTASSNYMKRRAADLPILVDLEMRFKLMDQFPDYVQCLTAAGPGLESFLDPTLSPELARVLNDGMAELVAKHPDRFIGFAASLPMNNMDATMKELDRVINDLGANGVQIFTNVAGHPLDEAQFRPIFAKIAEHDKIVWLHPARTSNFPDYQAEQKSKYEIWWTFGWPYESSAAMSRLVFSGIFEEFPKLKIITHHLGAMIPYFQGKVGPGWDVLGARTPANEQDLVKHDLKRRIEDYFHMYYADTAIFGTGPLHCGLGFFGVDHVVYASDMPFDHEGGYFNVRETMRTVDNAALAPDDLKKIYELNARRLLNMPAK